MEQVATVPTTVVKEYRYSREDLDDILTQMAPGTPMTDEHLIARVQLLLLAKKDTSLFKNLQPISFKESVLHECVMSRKLLRAFIPRVRKLMEGAGLPIDEDLLT